MKVRRLSRLPVSLLPNNIGLVDAVDGPVGGHLRADDAGEGRHEVHDREHRVSAGTRLDLTRPAHEAEGSDRSLGDFAQFSAEGTGVAVETWMKAIRTEGKERRLIQCVLNLLPTDPSSACQRILNAAIHDSATRLLLQDWT
jgi:hypothetical protein